MHSQQLQTNDGTPSRHRVFVVCAATRAELVDRTRALQATLTPHTALRDLAATLAADGDTQPQRLAVIAATVDELNDRLGRALGRLEDDSRTRIRDNAGIYYAAAPLYQPGSVAFLYPGEGAQYLGMLAGLPERFPAIESVLTRCRAIEPELDLPAGLMQRCLCSTESEDPQIDELLQSFSFSIFTVMACSWCLGDVLNSLHITADMIAGHSAGESSALFAAGAIPADTPFSVLNTINDIGRHDGSDSAMLAVGAGKARVEGLLSAQGLLGDKAQLYIAMDNCPHQVIVVGTAAAIERAQQVLKKANIILQRLSIPRPYHTPLFRPYMPTLTELGFQVQLQTPQIPLYSCSSAMRFSDDPEQIRQLSIDHWEQPVEFTRLIQQMYEDGARIFVEAGPRGNLTSFAEDTLRGRPVVTVAANRMGRSATLQIAHVVGELWVQRVPLSLSAFNSDASGAAPENESAPPVPSRFEIPISAAEVSTVLPSDPAHSAGAIDAIKNQPPTSPPPPSPPPTSPPPTSPPRTKRTPPTPAEPARIPAHVPAYAQLPTVLRRNRMGSGRPQRQRIWDAIRQSTTPQMQNRQQQALLAHQRVMQSFLETQRSVINGYLQARGGGSAPTPPTAVSPDAAGSSDVEFTSLPPGDSATVTATLPPNMPLAGEVVEHVPGERMVIRRPLDLAEDRYADHHTVGGQSISGVNPNQHGLPVMPMTFFLEMLAEAAKQLFPQLHVTAIRKLRLRKWLPFYADDPGTVEVRITRQPPAPSPSPDPSQLPGAIMLSAEVHDLGTSETAQRLGEKGQAAVCQLEMRPHYPHTDFESFVLEDPWPCPTTIERLYMNLFHGPILQGVTSLDLMDRQYIEGSATVQPREEVFASTQQPDFIFDPVMLDIVMHPLAAWHLADPDQTGRIMLPFEQDEIEFFGGAPGVGERLQIQGQLEKMTTRQCIQNLLVRRADGRPWCRMRRAKFWRFYLPFYNVSFHGPKDIYYLTEDWSSLLPSSELENDRLAQPFTLENMSCIRFEPPQDMVNPAIQVAASYVVLSPTEKAQFERLEGSLAEKGLWMFQRFAAKDAVRRYREHNNDVRTFAADVEVQSVLDYEQASSQFATSARESFDDRPFPPVASVARDGFHYAVASFHDRFGLDAVHLTSASDRQVPDILQPVVDQVTTAIGSQAVAVQRVMSAIDAINLAQGEALDFATVALVAYHNAHPHHYFEVTTASAKWLVLSTGGDDVIVSIAVDQTAST